MKMEPENILDTFQNQNLAPGEWESLADQKFADEIGFEKNSNDKRDDKYENPPGFSNESSQE